MKLADLKTSIFKTSETASNKSDVSYIFFIGELDGKILEGYSKIFDKEKELGVTASWVVCPGSVGIWPDPKRLDKATRKKSDEGDFYKLYYENWVAPRNTLVISGAHEDHAWLHYRKKTNNTQILGNFWHLNNGIQTIIGPSILGFGKVFSPKVYYEQKNKHSYKYYTRREVEKATSCGPTDILLTYQAPLGQVFGNKKSNSEGIKTIIYATRPKLLVHSGYSFSKKYSSLGTQCVSLNKMEILVIKYNFATKGLDIC